MSTCIVCMWMHVWRVHVCVCTVRGNRPCREPESTDATAPAGGPKLRLWCSPHLAQLGLTHIPAAAAAAKKLLVQTHVWLITAAPAATGLHPGLPTPALTPDKLSWCQIPQGRAPPSSCVVPRPIRVCVHASCPSPGGASGCSGSPRGRGHTELALSSTDAGLCPPSPWVPS